MNEPSAGLSVLERLIDRLEDLGGTVRPWMGDPGYEGDLDHLERAVGKPLPAEYRQIYSRYNGQSGGTPLFSHLEFTDLETNLSAVGPALAEEPLFFDDEHLSDPPGAIDESYTLRHSVPFATDGCGNYIGVDLDPGPTGTYGQVITFGRDELTRRVIASSLVDFLSWMVAKLEDGSCTLDSERDEEDPPAFCFVAAPESTFFGALPIVLEPADVEVGPEVELSGAWKELIDLSLSGRRATASRVDRIYHVSLRDFDITDLQPVCQFSRLRSLDLAGSKITDYSALSRLATLKKLNVTMTSFADANVLRGLSELRYLFARGTPLRDLDPLREVTSLRGLHLSETPVTDVTVLADLPFLSDLDLAKTNVRSFAPISRLTSVLRLNLSFAVESGRADEVLSALPMLVQLRSLIIEGCGIRNLEPLRGLEALEEVSIVGNPIRDLSLLDTFGKLRYIHLEADQLAPLIRATERFYELTCVGDMNAEQSEMWDDYHERKWSAEKARVG